jgi:hypothetical protein
MSHFFSPYLGSKVELTEERRLHIEVRHPDLLPQFRARLAEVLLDPDQIRRSRRLPTARLFSRW